MNLPALKRDLDHAVVGKIKLTPGIIAVALVTLLDEIEELRGEIDLLKENVKE